MLAYKSLIAKALLLVALSQAVATNAVLGDPDDCPQICPALYAPVCATDGLVYKEFSNSCDLKASNCRRGRAVLQPYSQIDMYWCTSEFVENLHQRLNSLDLEATECLKPCPMIYAPVCVSNGKYRGLISNSCVMDTINCAVSKSNLSASLFRILKADTC